MSPSILAIGTAVPENAIKQPDIAEFMAAAHGLDALEKRQLKILYRATGISQRHSVISDYSSVNMEDWKFYPKSNDLKPFPTTEDRGKLYRQQALKLSSKAIDNCLEQCEVDTSRVTHLITVSCTGMYAPGLDIDIINHYGLSKNIERTAINFMGCYAAITAIKHAKSICSNNEKSIVLVVCLELCTIHFQNKKTDDNLLANSIFSDGAGAFLMGSEPEYQEKVRLKPIKFHSDLLPEGSDDMAWNIGDFGYEMKLSAYVPDLIQSGIKSLISNLTNNIERKPQHFAIHPGGKKILEVIENELEISRDQNLAAHEVLRHYGNMSSPTLLFVLKKLLGQLSDEHKGENVLSLAFGPGLTLESMLLEVC